MRLRHMIDAIDNVLDFTSDVTIDKYKNDRILQFAVIKNLEIVGEAAYLLTLEFKQQHPDVPWESIVAMRHVLVHGYYQVSNDIVWATIEKDLKPLRKQLEQLIVSNKNN